ncbi:polysaccharide deacetylase [Arsenicitalea aurantiaca]|uniref:Chitooligosaccharide deacetylase n=1 Tax=Arsenicitalea aurantiaca TaxID=1783274 RepID=A0A433XKI3_9HYPH|nr:polysaccharide deacetylase family protein [Arsenicitalea aurantiaca]RUT34590.1 polysaccharide deacetylase [Arsenicitalea aurantiaca]
MPELHSSLDALARKVTHRLIWHSPGPRIDVRPARPIVTFTFDDVPDTALTAGATILERHGVRGTFYIAGGLAGTTEPGRRLIGADQVGELADRGHELGCHTFSHPWVRRLDKPTLFADLDRNAAFHAEHAPGVTLKNFAYPYNAPKLGIRGEMMARYRTCRGGVPAINRGKTDPAFLRSIEIRPPDAYARTLTRWIDDVAAEPGWLIFFTHDISDTPTPFGCMPDTLDMLVGHALEKGCEVLTLDAALDRMAVPERNR